MSFSRLILVGLTAGLLSVPVLAQDPPPAGEPGESREREGRPQGEGRPQRPPGSLTTMPRLSPEKAQAAWQAQVAHLAKAQSLNEEQRNAVLAAYTDARQKHGEAVAQVTEASFNKARENPGNREGRGALAQELQKQIAEVTASYREELRTGISKSLSQEQVDKIMPALGSFMPQWDSMTDTLMGFKLEAPKNSQAMDTVQKYIVAAAKAREEGQRASGESRQEMNDAMRALLTEEQFAQFQRLAVGRMRGGEGRGRGGENAAGGAAGEGAPPRGRDGGPSTSGGAGGASGGGAADELGGSDDGAKDGGGRPN